MTGLMVLVLMALEVGEVEGVVAGLGAMATGEVEEVAVAGSAGVVVVVVSVLVVA